MRFINHLTEAKSIVSPMLKSLIKKGTASDAMVKNADEVLTKLSDKDNKMSMNMSTAGSEKGDYYVTITRKDKDYKDISKKVVTTLKKYGHTVGKSKDKGNEGYWIYFK